MVQKALRATRSVTYVAVAAVVAAASLLIGGSPVHAAACAPPTTDYGSVASSITVPANGTYRIWSRMMIPNTTSATYLLEVDGQNCFTVGNPNIPVNTWTWVNTQENNTAVSLSLTQGAHTVKFIGRQSGVKLDRIIATSDAQCTPVGNGDNCDVPLDTTPPSVNLTAPAEGGTVSGNSVNVTATAADNTGVSKVEFLVDTTVKNSDTTAPYSFAWNTTTEQNGSHRVTAKAYDAAGNVSSDTVLVTVQNGDTQAPSVPTEVTATAQAYNKVNVSWKASTDNVGVKGYIVSRNGTVLAQLGAVTTYSDTSTAAATQYSYQVTAIDAAGNKSAASASASVTTPPLVTPDTQAPSAPTGLTAAVISSQQINLTWTASTDNIQVTAYDVYRSGNGQTNQKIATVTSTSYGDTGLSAGVEYSYSVKARDAAGNTSDASSVVTAKTNAKKRKSRVHGYVTTTAGRSIAGATVSVSVEGVTYSATTNKNGHYRIRGIPQGRYAVTFKAAGYASRTAGVVLDDRTITLNAQLRKR